MYFTKFCLFLGAGSSYFSGAPSVVFHLQEGPSRDSLTKVLSQGYAGCVHFQQTDKDKKCDIKVMILLYNQEKNTYLGFIPNDQLQFVDCIRKVIQQQKEQQRAATGNMMQQQQQQQQQQQLQQQQGNMMNPQGQMPNQMGMQGGTMTMTQNGKKICNWFLYFTTKGKYLLIFFMTFKLL